MGVVIQVAAALAAYYLGILLIDMGESILLIAIAFIAALFFTVEGGLTVWTEIESAREQREE